MKRQDWNDYQSFTHKENQMEKMRHGICFPNGFLATGVHTGLKRNNKLDLALILSTCDSVCAAVFTINKLKAAPIILTENRFKNGAKFKALVINSGNANSCTGYLGINHAKAMAKAVASSLGINEEEVAVSSTGVIGKQLPIDKIILGIHDAATKLSAEGGMLSAKAIMTTDTFEKTVELNFKVGNIAARIGGIAKGSGMIHPCMATMLAFITTDVAISADLLQKSLNDAVALSFNQISVDGDSSTNDMVMVLANGQAGNTPISSESTPEYKIFSQALQEACINLAKQIIKDGEGATKLIEVIVEEAPSESLARSAARAICKSTLVKTALFGEDANWGRIANVLGMTNIELDINRLRIQIGDLILFSQGEPQNFSEEKAKAILSQNTIEIRVNLGLGECKGVAWGCDLSYDYVTINSYYRS